MDCGRPAVGGRVRCRRCLDGQSARARRVYEARKAEGLCVNCGWPLSEIDEGYVSHNRSDCKPTRRRVA